jgi:hypothetical protein
VGASRLAALLTITLLVAACAAGPFVVADHPCEDVVASPAESNDGTADGEEILLVGPSAGGEALPAGTVAELVDVGTGDATRLLEGALGEAVWSADGERFAVLVDVPADAVEPADPTACVFDASGESLFAVDTRGTPDPMPGPAWYSAGDRLALMTDAGVEIFDAEGNPDALVGEELTTSDHGPALGPQAWSPTGDAIVLADLTDGVEIVVIDVDTSASRSGAHSDVTIGSVGGPSAGSKA